MSKRPFNKPSAYVCPDCGRAYKAAETLNRHRKNHSETTSYSCTTCNASFKRKDLLDRHSQIHVVGRPPTARNRSQRACDRCSKLKTRCDNSAPCTRCVRGGHECTYREARCRARTDRSSTSTTSCGSTNSSAQSSPFVTPRELNGLTEDYCLSDSRNVTSAPSQPSAAIFDTFWLDEPAWQWPRPQAQMTILDPSLDNNLPPCALFDDPLENMSWYSRKHTGTSKELHPLDDSDVLINATSPSNSSSTDNSEYNGPRIFQGLRKANYRSIANGNTRSSTSSPSSSSGPDFESDRQRFYSLLLQNKI